MRASSLTGKLFAASLTAASVVGGLFPAAAQQAFSERECFEAVAIASAIKQKYNGRLSQPFIDSLARFRDTRCDVNTDFVRTTGTSDNDAFGEFRVNLVALRSGRGRAQRP